MKRESIPEAMNGISDRLIAEAAEKLGFLNGAPAVKRPKGQSAFSRFMNSGWGVAAVCALVVVGVMGGIVWAGWQSDPPPMPPLVTVEGSDTAEPTPETESGDTTDVSQSDPVFDHAASLAAIDQLASENDHFSIRLKYNTDHYGALPQEFSGDLGQAGGKYWYRVDLDGTAILEEEGGYYHKYVFEGSKYRYYDTYEMTDTEEFEKTFNGRYWWKNYLDELTFDAYDELVYTGVEQVGEQDCHMFSFEGTVTDGSQVKLALYVNPSDNHVMKMEVEIIKSSHTSHLSTDVRKAVIEVELIRTGDELTGPTLPDPKWNGPVEEPNEPEDPTQGGVVIPPSDTEQNPSIDVESGMLHQFPLTSPDDTMGYVVLPDLWSGGATAVEFFVFPTDTAAPAHTSALKFDIPENSTVNIQIVAVEKSPTEYSFLYMADYIVDMVVDGVDTYRVGMMCAEIQFFEDKSLSETGNDYYTMRDVGTFDVTYTDQTMQNVLSANRIAALDALDKAEAMMASYTEDAGYQYTVLYLRTMHDESVDTPSNWVPAFSFELFREFGLMD